MSTNSTPPPDPYRTPGAGGAGATPANGSSGHVPPQQGSPSYGRSAEPGAYEQPVEPGAYAQPAPSGFGPAPAMSGPGSTQRGYPPPPNSTPDVTLDPLPIPSMTPGIAAPDAVRIGLWGAPASGKTTYLAALPIAAMQQQRHGKSNWLINGLSEDSNDFLVGNFNQLASEQRFPPPTQSPDSMSWSFNGTEAAPGLTRGRSRDVAFVLEMQDAPGEFFRTGQVDPHVLDHLTRASGLVYLFDPLLDGEPGSRSLDFFYATLNALSTRIRDDGRFDGGRLPHNVAVCVTKFDHPEIFEPAVRARWVTQDDTGSRLPRVPEHLGRAYFDWICDDFRGSTARMVRDALLSHFHPERISFYATSAIGFRLNPQNVFDYRAYANVEMVDGSPSICTPPVPINVLEPLIDLERRGRARVRRWGRR
ncbi:hypothetical protein ACWCQ0_25515 [Streptomyces massasporeus]|uniref:Uncharacterized protein n=1 Tax=Streptomyces massasporeus TaxID=67324 RepID=A0ABW6LN40_9ACTN